MYTHTCTTNQAIISFWILTPRNKKLQVLIGSIYLDGIVYNILGAIFMLNSSSNNTFNLVVASTKTILTKSSLFKDKHTLGGIVQDNLWMVWQHYNSFVFTLHLRITSSHSFWSCKYALLEMWQCQWCQHSFRSSLKRQGYRAQQFSYFWANWI